MQDAVSNNNNAVSTTTPSAFGLDASPKTAEPDDETLFNLVGTTYGSDGTT